MSDYISRQAAIDAMCELMHHWFGGDPKDEIREIKQELEKLPTSQLNNSSDCINRQAAIDLARELIIPMDEYGQYNQGINNYCAEIIKLPSAEPDNSCDGCKYENADDGVLVPCGFCKRSHPDNYERRTDDER